MSDDHDYTDYYTDDYDDYDRENFMYEDFDDDDDEYEYRRRRNTSARRAGSYTYGMSKGMNLDSYHAAVTARAAAIAAIRSERLQREQGQATQANQTTQTPRQKQTTLNNQADKQAANKETPANLWWSIVTILGLAIVAIIIGICLAS